MQLKPATISTPLRTILMEYVSDAGLSQLEQDTLTKYEQLHIQLFTIASGWRKAEADVRALKRPQERIKQELRSLEEEVKLYRHLANFTQEELAALPDPDEKQLLDPADLMEHGNDLQALFDPHHEAVWAFNDYYKTINEGNDTMLAMYADFEDNYYNELITEVDNVTISLIRLDDDFNEFNIMMEELTDLIYKTADDYMAVFAEYGKITNEVGAIFKHIERVSEEVTRLRAGGMNRPEELN